MTINIYLDNNRTIKCDNTIIGKTYENEATTLRFYLTKEMLDKDFYLEFEKQDGSKYASSKIDNFIISDSEYYIEYLIPNSLLDIKGELKTEIVLRKDKEVWKSYTLKFNVLNSINASEEIPNQYPDFVSSVEELVKEIENGLTPTIGENGNWFILDKDTGKPSQGKEGPQGPQGKAGAVKLIPVNEFPTENIEEDAIYLKPSENPSEANVYDEYVYVDGNWEKLSGGSSSIDLTGYATEEYVNNAIDNIDNQIGNINNVLATLTEVSE